MPKHLIIRNATNEDVGSLVELAASSFRDTYLLLDDPVDIEEYITTKFTPAIFASVLKDDLSTLLVAIDDEQYVGYSHIVLSTPPPCVTGPSPIELARLYLRQGAIGKGYGAALMRAVHRVATHRHRQTIWLGVYGRNERARDFYRRWGFADVGTKAFVFGGCSYDDPVMAASVQEDVSDVH